MLNWLEKFIILIPRIVKTSKYLTFEWKTLKYLAKVVEKLNIFNGWIFEKINILIARIDENSKYLKFDSNGPKLYIFNARLVEKLNIFIVQVVET